MTELDQLRALDRSCRHGCTECVDADPLGAGALRLDVRGGDSRVVLARRDVQCRAQRARLDDRAVAEPLRQLFLAKALDARPERDIRRRRVLRLQRDELRDGVVHRDPLPLQEHLPQQQRAIQLPQRHGVTAALSKSRGGSAKSAGRSRSSTRCVISRSQGYAATREEREPRAHGRRRVVERAAHRQLVVVDAVGVDGRARVAREAAEHDHRPTGAREPDRVLPGRLRACRLEHDVRVAPVPRLGAEGGNQLLALLATADDHRPPARIRHAGREHQPDRARAEDRDAVAGLHARALDAAQAAREWLDQRGNLGRERRRNRVEVDRGDALGDDEPVCVGAGEELERSALLAARTAVARAARRGVRRDDAATVDETAELVPERRRRLARQQRVPAPIRLQVGAVGERHLDLHEDVARAGLRPRHILDPQIVRRIETRCLHGVKTTFNASPRR